MKLATVHQDGSSLQLDNGLRLLVMQKDRGVAVGWKVGDEVVVSDATDQSRDYLLRSSKADGQVIKTMA